MEYTFISPNLPTVRRWWKITSTFRGLSLLRMMEYELLSDLQLSGRVLDMGGGRRAKYLKVFPNSPQIESANIDPGIDPHHLVSVEGPLPFEADSFDEIICFNTLEHIFDPASVVNDLYRVLKPGGRIHIIVPFMFRIHGHPDDYTRATPSWWRETFVRVGFAKLSLLPLVWGRKSTVSVVPGMHGLFPRLRLHLAMLGDIMTAKILFRSGVYDGRRGQSICGTAPGWYMVGTK
jgi:SAM-dependent methyltransferase